MKFGTDIKAVWIASSPRCGSMWVFNATRHIARATGLKALPANVPQTSEDMIAAAIEGIRDPATDQVRVVKVHAKLHPQTPNSRFILPRRDVRDAMISFMRFMCCDFEAGLDFVRNAIALNLHYDHFPADRTLFVDYADIVTRPATVVDTIAAFLDAPIEPVGAEAIAAELDKKNVASLIERTEQDLIQRSSEGSPISAEEVVVLGPEQVRAFDTATGFQSGHVSDYQEGEWRRILTAAQQGRLEAVIAAAGDAPARRAAQAV